MLGVIRKNCLKTGWRWGRERSKSRHRGSRCNFPEGGASSSEGSCHPLPISLRLITASPRQHGYLNLPVLRHVSLHEDLLVCRSASPASL